MNSISFQLGIVLNTKEAGYSRKAYGQTLAEREHNKNVSVFVRSMC